MPHVPPPPSGIVLEYPPCEICGTDAPVPVASRTDLLLGGPTVYTMNRCPGCGVLYQHPRPTAASLAALYPADASYPPYRRATTGEPFLRRFGRHHSLTKRCRLVLRHRAGGRLLDGGCATGDFLAALRAYPGWSLCGLEFSAAAVRYAAASTGVPVIRGQISAAAFATGSFDVVTLWDVLEHVADPRSVLAEMARLLRPGGLLVINQPNTASLDRRIFGHLWVGYELPRHLYLFPPALLRRLLGEYGFREVEQRCLYGSHSVLADNLTYVVEAALGRNQVSRLLGRVFRSLPARVLTAPYIALLDRLGLGGNLATVFVRTA